MVSDDSEKTPPLGTPRPAALAISAWDSNVMGGGNPSALPISGKASAGRPSQPPPVPEGAKRTPLPAQRAPPPLPEKIGGERAETTDPSIRAIERDQQMLLRILRSFYPEDLRIRLNGNAKPALKAHVDQMRDTLAMNMEAQTRYFFLIPTKWVALAAAALAIAAGGFAIHSCNENKKLEQRIEQLENKSKAEKAKPAQEKEAPKPTSFYIPKALSMPPRVPNRIPQRVARNSLRA